MTAGTAAQPVNGAAPAATPVLGILDLVTGQLRRTANAQPGAPYTTYLADLLGCLNREATRFGGITAIGGEQPAPEELLGAGLLRLKRSRLSQHVEAVADGLMELGFILAPSESRGGRVPQNYMRILPPGGVHGIGYLKPRNVTFIRVADRADLTALPGARASRQNYGGVDFRHDTGPDPALAAAAVIAAKLRHAAALEGAGVDRPQ
jgi:hypothetical protein